MTAPITRPLVPADLLSSSGAGTPSLAPDSPLCIHCGRPVRPTCHGWGHCVVFARVNVTDQHRAAPSRYMQKLYALRVEAEL